MVPTREMNFTEDYKEKLKQRIKEKILVNSIGCWEWQSSSNKGKQNHGRIRVTNNGIRFVGTSHRVSYLIWKGKIPKGKYILHKCPNGGNPKCCNPEHLEIGNQKENCKDRKLDGNECDRRGIKNGRSTITEEQVKEVRNLRSRDKTYTEISKITSISKHTIANIIQKKTWSHL